MSFILDALQKAERDRLREDPKNLDDFASAHWDPYEKASSILAPRNWLLGFLVIIIVLGVVLYIQGWTINPATDVISVATLQPAQTEVLLPSAVDVKPELSLSPAVEQPITVATSLLPELIVAGHMFIAEGSSSNRLFIGQSSYREGDKITQEWTLVSIKPDYFIISAGESTEILPYR
ncbi:MAG: hypothetical protein NZ730_06350 [Porticoccaceae bacterium]|nr:hypothetical protein [Porticoccaceae bacterium]